MYNYYNYLEPCSLNAAFQHFIPRFDKKKLPYFADLTQIGDEKRPKDRMTLRKTLIDLFL
jgi:hypothetical protein